MIKINTIDKLDPKCTITFLKNITNAEDNSSANMISEGIWQIDNFLTSKECDEIVQACDKTGFENLNYRKGKRLIAFDANGKLLETLEKRLHNDCALERINKKKFIKPYGFGSSGVKWKQNVQRLNKCIRINKYEKGDLFYFHRDAQYTKNTLIKSNLSVLIYLNDFIGGATTFRIPKKQYEHRGYTTQEELKLITEYSDVTIQPKKRYVSNF